MIAHVGGVPVEEFLPLLVTGAGGYAALRVGSLWARLRARAGRRTPAPVSR